MCKAAVRRFTCAHCPGGSLSPDTPSGRSLQGRGPGARARVSGQAPPRRLLQQQLQLLQRQAHPQLLLRHQVHHLLHLVGEVLHGVQVQRLGGATPVSERPPRPRPPRARPRGTSVSPRGHRGARPLPKAGREAAVVPTHLLSERSRTRALQTELDVGPDALAFWAGLWQPAAPSCTSRTGNRPLGLQGAIGSPGGPGPGTDRMRPGRKVPENPD